MMEHTFSAIQLKGNTGNIGFPGPKMMERTFSAIQLIGNTRNIVFP